MEIQSDVLHVRCNDQNPAINLIKGGGRVSSVLAYNLQKSLMKI